MILLPSANGSSISTNKAFILETNNVLPPDETNFFVANSNLLNQSVLPSSGGGGGVPAGVLTNNANGWTNLGIDYHTNQTSIYSNGLVQVQENVTNLTSTNNGAQQVGINFQYGAANFAGTVTANLFNGGLNPANLIWSTQTAGSFFGGPTFGAANPVFRNLVMSDLPIGVLTNNQAGGWTNLGNDYHTNQTSIYSNGVTQVQENVTNLTSTNNGARQVAINFQSGSASFNGVVSGNGAGLTNLQAGSLPPSLVSSLVLTNVYTNSLAAASSDWQLADGATATYGSGYTTVTPSGNTDSSYVLTNHYTGANNFKYSFEFNEPNGGGIGAGVRPGYGVDGYVSLQYSKFWLLGETGTSNDVIEWPIFSTSPTTFAFDTTNLEITDYPTTNTAWTNVWIYCSFRQFNGAGFLLLSNETTGAIISECWMQAIGNLTYYDTLGASGWPTINVYAGQAKLRNFAWSLYRPANTVFGAVGDSIMEAYSDIGPHGWPFYAAQEMMGESVLYGRGGDRIATLIQATNELAALGINTWLNALGGNDNFAGGVPSYVPAWLNFIKSISTTAINIVPTPRWGGAGYGTPTGYIQYCETNQILPEYINLFPSLQQGTSLAPWTVFEASGDPPHLNDYAERIMGNAVASYLRLRQLPP